MLTLHNTHGTLWHHKLLTRVLVCWHTWINKPPCVSQNWAMVFKFLLEAEQSQRC